MGGVVRLCGVLMACAVTSAVADEPANAERPRARQMDQPAERPADPEGRPAAGRPAHLGIATGPVSAELREHANLPERGGLVVTRVEPGSPAAKAGLKANDILLEVDGCEVASPLDLTEMIEAAGPGARVTLDIMRRGKPLEVRVVLGAKRAGAGIDGRPADAVAGGPGGMRPGAAGRPGRGMPRDARDLLAEALAMAEAPPIGGNGGSVQVQSSTVNGVMDLRAVSRDREGTVEITVRGGSTTVRILGPDGDGIHEGPLDEPADLEAVPEVWRDKVRSLDERATSGIGRVPVPLEGI